MLLSVGREGDMKNVLGIGEGLNRGEEVTERRLDRDCREVVSFPV